MWKSSNENKSAPPAPALPAAQQGALPPRPGSGSGSERPRGAARAGSGHGGGGSGPGSGRGGPVRGGRGRHRRHRAHRVRGHGGGGGAGEAGLGLAGQQGPRQDLLLRAGPLPAAGACAPHGSRCPRPGALLRARGAAGRPHTPARPLLPSRCTACARWTTCSSWCRSSEITSSRKPRWAPASSTQGARGQCVGLLPDSFVSGERGLFVVGFKGRAQAAHLVGPLQGCAAREHLGREQLRCCRV